MTMKEITITEKGHDGNCPYLHETCRGAIVRGDEILLSHEVECHEWLFPGGGLEDGETYEECCAREILEETGNIVRVGELFAVVNEYYGDTHYVHRYFVCEIVGKGASRLTEREIRVDARPEWIGIDKYKKILEETVAKGEIPYNPYRIHLRELRALEAYVDYINERSGLT